MTKSEKALRKTILLAEPDDEWARPILHDPSAKLYLIKRVKTGTECLHEIAELKPDLLIIDLFLPEIHAIEIIRRVKEIPELAHMGFIIMSFNVMIQNYHAVLKAGADYYLEKPFDIPYLFQLTDRFFHGKLSPAAFSGKESKIEKGEHCFVPRLHSPNYYLKFWGTRGSNPVAGVQYIRYGGNTACLEVRCGEDALIIDAGTGIRELGYQLHIPHGKNVHLFIGHTHWDHIAGFPFFQPTYNSEAKLTIWTPIGFEKSAKDHFLDMLAYAYFPVRLDDMSAKMTFKDINVGIPIHVGEITLHTHYASHPGATVCFKIEMRGKTIGYATDNELLMGFHGDPWNLDKDDPLIQSMKEMVKFFKDCDILIHEAQYTPIEYQNKVGWGHSSITNAAFLVKQTCCKEWIITHHDPSHTDTDLQKKYQLTQDILEDTHTHVHVRMAYDGLMIPL